MALEWMLLDIFGLTLEQIATLAVVTLLWMVVSTYLIWRFIVPHFFGPYVRQTITEMLSEPDEETQKAIQSLVGMILSTPINTGRKIKDEDGKEHPEIVPLTTYLGREMSHYMMMKIKGMRGGLSTQAGAALESMAANDPNIASLLGVGGPRKGQSTQEYLMEQLVMRLMPEIEKRVAKKLNTTNVDTSEW